MCQVTKLRLWEEPEVELPDTQFSPAKGKLALSIGECESQLDELEHVYIAPAW